MALDSCPFIKENAALKSFPLRSNRAFALIGGTLRGERRTTGLHYGLKLHQLDSSPVGVVEVGLPFAVLAHLRAVVAGAESIFRDQASDRLLHVGDAE